MNRWTLGPRHRDYGVNEEYGPEPYTAQRNPDAGAHVARGRASGFHCSQCGAEKPSARGLCPCGAFAKYPGMVR